MTRQTRRALVAFAVLATALMAPAIGRADVVAQWNQIAEQDTMDVVWDASRGVFVIARSVHAGDEPSVWMTFVRTDGSVRTDEKIAATVAGTVVRAATLESGVVGIFFERSNGAQLSYLRLSGSDRQLYRNVWDLEDNLVVVGRSNHFTLARWVDVTSRRRALVWTVIDTSANQVVPQKAVFDAMLAGWTPPAAGTLAGRRHDHREGGCGAPFR